MVFLRRPLLLLVLLLTLLRLPLLVLLRLLRLKLRLDQTLCHAGQPQAGFPARGRPAQAVGDSHPSWMLLQLLLVLWMMLLPRRLQLPALRLVLPVQLLGFCFWLPPPISARCCLGLLGSKSPG